ncbi:hypothetical protein A2272_03035 [Candidatus Peregrinibacteria bacterium RIFOXYA12_FULL_33_12]|nr:MAG: hypothetical protein A2272_03035 [Candidatus Peregrinibacteria bacterium RIFOXYA12_FULL_33_12]
MGWRLFYLQIVKHNYYLKIVEESHYGITQLPARRGEILLDDRYSNTKYKLATTTTYDLLFADPSIIAKDDNASLLANKIGPILFDLNNAQEKENKRLKKLELQAITEEDKNKIIAKSDQELLNDYISNLKDQMGQYIRSEILLLTNVDPELEQSINSLNLDGVSINEEKNLYAYPKQISSATKTAKILAPLINFDRDYLEILLEGKNHYTVLARKLPKDKADQLEIIFNSNSETYHGIKLTKEHYRYYPEQTLAAQVLGYINSAGIGQYGIEGRYNHVLAGKAGFIKSQKDAAGDILTVGDSKVQIAEDGADITLTIDRAIQLEVEKNLPAAVREYNAESAQAIVMNPKTGEILAMANYPTFDPNEYAQIFNLKEIHLSQAEIDNFTVVGSDDNKHIYFYTQRNPDRRFEVFEDKEIPSTYYRYDNFVGSEVFRNKAITDLYEPGSTFKPVVMASAIDADEVQPQSTFDCSGPIKVPKISNPKSDSDYDFIKTYNNQYHGVETMTQILENSDNVGMAQVAETLGYSLFYNYIRKFGYGEKTGIEFDSENKGQLEHYEYWTQSELLTKGYGQGISVTLIQHATALSALANNGTLMQPFIVKSIDYHGNNKTETFEPRIVDQVITKETADKITSMMISVIENGQAKKAQVPRHFVAGKTGTAQTYQNGKALFGTGTTITSFIGFGPVSDPKFLVLVKVDKPLNGPYAETSALPIAQKILDFLFKYYNVPPDKKF